MRNLYEEGYNEGCRKGFYMGIGVALIIMFAFYGIMKLLTY